MTAYRTLEEAVYRAADAARAVFGNHREAISVVYEKDGQFLFTPPRTQGYGNSTNVSAKITIPKGSARFLVHNHPPGAGESAFSQDDIDMADKLGVPSAIIFGRESPTIRVFRPGKSEVRTVTDQGSRRPVRTSLGEAFDWKPPEPASPPPELATPPEPAATVAGPTP